MVPTTLRYQTKAINKKDVACNDDTGLIKLTLWRSCIECIKESGVYFIQQVKIEEWPGGRISYTVNFPPNSIQLLTSEKYFRQSKRASHDHNGEGNFFKYKHCHTMTLAVYVPSRYALKLEFTKEIRKSVTMYYQQIAKYFDCKKEPVPQDLNDLVLEMLSDNSTVLVIDSRMNCIALKQG